MIILASQSPRRRELLEQIGCSFQVITSNAEESNDETYSPEEVVMANAVLKARAVAREHANMPVLGSDTVVSLDGHIYGKPRDKEDAIRMLRILSGRSHKVSTGIAIVKNGQVYKDVCTTEVLFKAMTDEEINSYVASGEPLDKAGAYGIQGRAAVYIEGINGSYSNVVGLPLNCLYRLAEKAGVDLYGDNGAGYTLR